MTQEELHRCRATLKTPSFDIFPQILKAFERISHVVPVRRSTVKFEKGNSMQY